MCINFPRINKGKKNLRSRVIVKMKRAKIKWMKILLQRQALDMMELEEFRVDICKAIVLPKIACNGPG